MIYENAILDYLKKRANYINQEILSLGIASSSKNGMILNKPSSGLNCYTINHNITNKLQQHHLLWKTLTYHSDQPQKNPVLPIK